MYDSKPSEARCIGMVAISVNCSNVNLPLPSEKSWENVPLESLSCTPQDHVGLDITRIKSLCTVASQSNIRLTHTTRLRFDG